MSRPKLSIKTDGTSNGTEFSIDGERIDFVSQM